MIAKKLLICISGMVLTMALSSCDQMTTTNVTETLYENSSDMLEAAQITLPASTTDLLDEVVYTSMYESSLAQFRVPQKDDIVVTLVTNYGDIHLLMLPEAAPKAVENFITHGAEDYYDGVIFHRVIEDFMIQGGDPKGLGSGGESIWGEAFEDEFLVDYFPTRGALAMANSGANTNGSQFFIVQSSDYDQRYDAAMSEYGFSDTMIEAHKTLGGTPFLFNQHTVFGQVVAGMDVVDAIAGVDVNASNDKPLADVIIEDVLLTIID